MVKASNILLIVFSVIWIGTLIAHIIDSSMYVYIVYPLFVNVGAECAILAVSTFIVIAWSSITIFLVITVVIKHKNPSNILIGFSIFTWIFAYVATCVVFANSCDLNESGEKQNNFSELLNGYSLKALRNKKIAEDFLNFHKKVIDRIGKNHTVKEFNDLIIPYKHFLAFLILQLICLVTYIIALFLLKMNRQDSSFSSV